MDENMIQQEGMELTITPENAAAIGEAWKQAIEEIA